MDWKTALGKALKFLPLIGIVLFVYIIYTIGIEKITSAFVIIPFYFFILAIVPLFPRLLLYALRWQYISKKQKINADLIYFYKLSFVSIYYGLITPGAVGWYIKIFYLRKKCNAAIEKCVTNALLDGTIGGLVGLFIALIGAIVFFDRFPGFFPIILLFFILNIVALVIFLKKSRGNKIFKYIIRPLIPKKYKDRADQSLDSFYEDIPRLRDLIIPFLIESVCWVLLALQTYIFVLAFSINIPFTSFIFIHTISLIAVALMPVTIGGLGVREGAMVYMLLSFGVKPEISFVISFCGFLVKLLTPAIIGLFISFKEKMK